MKEICYWKSTHLGWAGRTGVCGGRGAGRISAKAEVEAGFALKAVTSQVLCNLTHSDISQSQASLPPSLKGNKAENGNWLCVETWWIGNPTDKPGAQALAQAGRVLGIPQIPGWGQRTLTW